MPSARRNRDNTNNKNSKKKLKNSGDGGRNGSKKTTETNSNVAGNTIGGGFNIEKKRKTKKMKDDIDSENDEDSDDAYDDLPKDFEDEEIYEDEAFAEEDKETYRGMRFYDEKRKEEEEEEEDDDDDGFGELIARAMQTTTTTTSKKSQSEDGDNAAAPVKRSEIVSPSVTAIAKKRKVRGVNDVLDEEERVDLDSEDDEETRELDDDEMDDKRKKMLDDILGENRRERRLEQPKPGSVTEYEKEGEYNAPVDLNGETLTLEDAIAALTRAKRSTGEIVNDEDEGDDDGDDDDDDTKPRKEEHLSGASLRALRRISGKEATQQPARKSVTEKMTRAAAYDMNKEDLGKWQPIVQENRKKETLTFEPSSKKMINRKDTLGALRDDFEPRTEMEKEIAAILKDEAEAADEEQIAKTEELALAKMDPEEAKARRARLAKMKALMFYHEQKAARLKKIKSKDYHRREKRANKLKAKKNGELMGDGGDDDDLGLTMDDDDLDENGLDSEGRTAEERREYFRVRERVLLKHRNTSRWAKRAIKKGIAHLPGTREAMAEQHRLAQQLKQKVYAPGDETSDDDGTNSSSESESDSEDEDPEQRRKRAKQKALDALYQANGGDEDMPEGLSKGVFALPFMKRAQEKKKMETAEAAKAILEEMQREDDGDGFGDGSDDDDDLNIVDEKDAQEWQAIAEKAGAATMKKKSRTEKQSEQQQKEVEKKKTAAPLPAKTVTISKSARALRERAALRNRPPARFEKFEPVLMEDDEDEKKRKAAAMKKAELYTEPRHIAEKAEKEKQKKKAIANGTYVEEEGGDINDDASDFPTTATTELDDKKSLVSRAFAGDDVEEAFKKEKYKDIEEELPDVERPILLPGWGAWEGERKSTPKWIIDQNKKADAIREKALKSRKDAKLKRVIISERYDKKAAAYNVEKLPRGYDSKAVYEGSMRTPLGADVNTDKQFRKLTKPKILKPSGAAIAPIKFPRNARPPTNDDESSKKKRRTRL
ncbi:unnamed protein product [Bathycoccus prasinos]